MSLEIFKDKAFIEPTHVVIGKFSYLILSILGGK